MNLACFIQARTTSTRLPNKVNLPLGNMTVIERVVDAATRIKGVSEVRVLWAHDFPWLPEEDVLFRYEDAFYDLEFSPDGIIRLTGDCPLIDPAVCDLVVDAFRKHRVAYASNIFPRRTFPDGMDCEIFTPDALLDAFSNAETEWDREHVTPWMQRNLETINVELPVDWSHVRLTLDTEKDYQWLKSVIESPRS